MSNELIVALLAFLGTIIGTVGGILAGTKVTEYRLQTIENKLDDFNKLNERVYALETHDEVLDAQLKGIEERINQRLDSMQERQNDLITDIRDAMNGA